MGTAEFKLDPDLDGLAHKLRREFALAKTAQLKRPYRPHPRFNNIQLWYAAAARCLELKASPDDFIHAAFIHCHVPGGPFPQQLANRSVDKWYQKYISVLGNSLPSGETVCGSMFKRLLQDVLNMVFTCATSRNLSIEKILLDDHILSTDYCPAHVRCILLPTDLILKVWSAKASHEILRNPSLMAELEKLNVDLSWMTPPCPQTASK
jgi:hypothetical protein